MNPANGAHNSQYSSAVNISNPPLLNWICKHRKIYAHHVTADPTKKSATKPFKRLPCKQKWRPNTSPHPRRSAVISKTIKVPKTCHRVEKGLHEHISIPHEIKETTARQTMQQDTSQKSFSNASHRSITHRKELLVNPSNLKCCGQLAINLILLDFATQMTDIRDYENGKTDQPGPTLWCIDSSLCWTVCYGMWLSLFLALKNSQVRITSKIIYTVLITSNKQC